MKNILFVCTGNTCRSPMAHAIFNKIADSDKFTADSCGIFADGVSQISNNAKIILKENGIDFNYTSKPVCKELLNQADIVVCMTQNHYIQFTSIFPEFSDKIFVMPEDIPDPYGGNLETYRVCYTEIYNGLLKVINEIKE